ncbi:hypothetical protein IQ250_08620 [Pseudanabaenaceae cyanobacterium LEGE 13415]|nr:hypothetical protein [Pseudanabaenaceae cyanobacterium LEGE 13415]
MITAIASLTLGGTALSASAMETMQPVQEGQFHRIEQPIRNKAIVTLGGLGLIGLELWWFLLSKPKSRKAMSVSEARSQKLQ